MSFWKKFVEFFTLEPSGERTRDSEGRFIADDKSTKNVNEAYKDGLKPKSKAKPKGKAKGKAKKGRGRPKGSKNKKK
jgi:hypothetical protein